MPFSRHVMDLDVPSELAHVLVSCRKDDSLVDVIEKDAILFSTWNPYATVGGIHGHLSWKLKRCADYYG